MKKNIIIGVIISLVCCYFSFKDIHFADLAKTFKEAEYFFILPVVLLVLLGHLIRSYRWGIIMNSLIKYDQKTLFAITSIGFMAVGLLPARLGEFVRPYLVKQKSGIKMSSTMATIIVERVFDLLTLMLFMFAVILKIDLPAEVVKAGTIMLAIAFGIFMFLIFLAVKKDFSVGKIDKILSILPERLEKPLSHLAHSFIEGLQILPDVKKTLYVTFLSFLLWTVIGMSAYAGFFCFNFELSVINAFAITVIVALGVMLPAAPGFVGTYHYACRLGLVSFGIAKSQAVSYALLLHFFQMMPIIIMGLACLPFQKISLSGFKIKDMAGGDEKEGQTPQA